MEIKLDLSRHCIATETKRLYNKSVSLYFKPDANTELLEKEITILQNALEILDFAYLRSAYKELAGNYDGKITLSMDNKNRPLIKINGKIVEEKKTPKT